MVRSESCKNVTTGVELLCPFAGVVGGVLAKRLDGDKYWYTVPSSTKLQLVSLNTAFTRSSDQLRVFLRGSWTEFWLRGKCFSLKFKQKLQYMYPNHTFAHYQASPRKFIY